MRSNVDTITYYRNGAKIGNGTLFTKVTNGNTKSIYFALSAYTNSELQIT